MAITHAPNNAHTLGWIGTALVVIGALNWLLIGLFEWNLVAALFGTMSWLTRVIYVLVGLSGLYLIYFARELNREAHHVVPLHP